PLATLPSPDDEAFVGQVKELAQSFFWATRGGEQVSDAFWVTMPKAMMEALFLAFMATHPKGTFVELATWARLLKIEELQNLLAPLSSLALGQMYGELTKIAARSGNRLERDVRVVIDEFGTLPRIYGVETALATLRSMGVGHYVFVQTSAQLTHHYGRELAAT